MQKYNIAVGGGKEGSAILSTLTNKLSEEGKKNLASIYLSSKGLPEFLTKLSKMSNEQQELLFGNKKVVADELLSIAKKYPNVKQHIFLPETGAKGAKTEKILEMLKGLGGAAALGAIGGGAGHLISPGAEIAGAIAGFGLPAAGAQLMQSNFGKNAVLRSLKDQEMQRRPMARYLTQGATNQGNQ